MSASAEFLGKMGCRVVPAGRLGTKATQGSSVYSSGKPVLGLENTVQNPELGRENGGQKVTRQAICLAKAGLELNTGTLLETRQLQFLFR